MPKITMFNFMSIDGFYAGPNDEIEWFKSIQNDDEWYKYTHKQSSSASTLIFGRKTYEMMKYYWPTADAIKNDPGMANAVNNSPKIVFSKTIKNVEEEYNWKNITLKHEINKEEILKLKEQNNMTILGSGNIVQQFSNLNLIDEYSLVIVPKILGCGKSLFKEVKGMNLKLTGAKIFKNGLTLLNYANE